MKKDVYYFSHDSNARRDPKIMALTSDYGKVGYAYFWILIEMLREQEGFIELTKTNTRALSVEMGLTVAECSKFIDDLVNEYELIKLEDNMIYSERLNYSIEHLKEIRDKRKKASEARWKKDADKTTETCKPDANASKLDGKPMQMQCKCNANAMQTDAKERKEKERKGKERKEKEEVVEQGSAAAANFSEASVLEVEDELRYIPDFDDAEEVKNSVIGLFKKFCNKPKPNPTSDLKPIMDFIFDRRPEMPIDICFEVVVNSFIILAQAERTDTGYLIGIIRRKKQEKYEEIMREIKRNQLKTRSYATPEDKKSAAEEYERNKLEQLAMYKDFYAANQDLFGIYEKNEIDVAFAANNLFEVSALIIPKMEEVEL